MATSLTAVGVEFPDSSVLATNPIPAGTRLVFHNATAPAGWTKDTSINDTTLRVVSGTPGSGGSSGFATALGSPSVSGSVGLSGEPGSGNLSTSISGNVNIGSTTLSTNQIPSHTHAYTAGRQFGTSFMFGANNPYGTETSRSTGGSGSHNHNAGHNLSGSVAGNPSIGTLSASLSSASTAINVKYQDFILAQKD